MVGIFTLMLNDCSIDKTPTQVGKKKVILCSLYFVFSVLLGNVLSTNEKGKENRVSFIEYWMQWMCFGQIFACIFLFVYLFGRWAFGTSLDFDVFAGLGEN